MEISKLKSIIKDKTKTPYFAKSLSPYRKEILELSGASSISEGVYIILHDIKSPPKCIICGNFTKFQSFHKGYAKTCSKKCSAKLGGKAHADTYSKETYEKGKQTLKEKHGVVSPLQIPESKEKFKETCLVKYGETHHMKTSEIKNKIKSTFREKYGVESYFETNEAKQKRSEWISWAHKTGYFKKYFLDNYGVDSYHKTDQYFERMLGSNPEKLFDGRRLIEISEDTGISIYMLKRYIRKNNIEYVEPRSVSTQEIEVRRFLDSLNVDYIVNSRSVIAPYELDIYIPEHKMAIEINGLYWNSDLYKEPGYHQKKYNLCKNSNITLIQITDGEWNAKSEIWKALLRHKLGMSERIYARKTSVMELTTKEARDFTNKHHVYGHTNSRHYLGLMYSGELVSVMSFSKPRFAKKYDWEMVRFCSSKAVVGGFSKLLKHFKKSYDGSIISYSNSNLSTGNVYERNGFRLERQTSPSYFWTNTKENISRYAVQKHKLGYSESEDEYMRSRKFFKYHDAGNEVWIYD